MTSPRRLTIPVLIPAYQPEPSLVTLVRTLQDRGAATIIVVDDGSGPRFAQLFEQLSTLPDVHVIHHAVNLRKGAALKTGLRHALATIPECPGVVTADADGQHHPEDILRVASRLKANPGALILGVRTFDTQVPWRNRMGNRLTRKLIRLIVGMRVTDSQTGLRGIPRALIPSLLRLPSQGYEFELDMLIASKQQSFSIAEEPIRTIYLNGNRSSHFNHVTDSARVYFALFRFSIVSALTAAIDIMVFAIAFSTGQGILTSQALSRLVATVFNYAGSRHGQSYLYDRHSSLFSKYALVALGSSLISYGLLGLIHRTLDVPVIFAKFLTEALLFVPYFFVQRDFVFTQRHTPTPTAALPLLPAENRSDRLD